MTEPTDIRHLGRVLVVDDEPELMSILREMLANRQYDVVGCTSPLEALELLRARGADVLLADLMMPEMDGIRLLQAAQEIDAHLVGVIMTGQGTVSTAVEAMKTGAFDYLLKPFKLDTLLPVLTRALDVRRLRMENVRLQETVAIYELSKTVSYVLDPRAILDKLADGAIQQCEAEEASVMLPTHDGNELYVAAVRGPGREHLLGERVSFERGIAGWVARHGETVTLAGVAADDRFTSAAPRSDLQWAISMPMLVGGQLVGVLNVGSKKRAPLTLGAAKGLSILAAAAAGALEHARLYGEAREEQQRYRLLAERLSGLASFAREVNSTLDLDRLFDIALGQLASLSACAWCNISEYDREHSVFRIAAVWRREGVGALPLGASLSVDDSSSGIVLRTGLPYVIQDSARTQEPTRRQRSLAGRGVRARITVPVTFSGEFWGTMGVGYLEPGSATPERVEFLEAMAAHLGVAIQNAQLYQKAVTAQKEVMALNDSLEQRVRERTLELETAEGVLARERATLLAIMGSMSDGLIVHGNDTRILYASQRAADLLASPVALVGKTAPEVLEVLRDRLADPDRAYASWTEMVSSPGGSFDLTVAGEPRRDLRCVVFPVIDLDGDRIGTGTVLRDVSTERELQRMKDEIVAVVSHELRTPLASLVGFADLLLTREYDEDRRRQFLTVIREEGNRLTALINDFLDLQRLESGRASISPEAIDLVPLLEKARNSAPADAQPRIVLDLGAPLPQVRADAEAVYQVLTNLVSNAVKYSPEGGEIRIVARSTDHSVQVSVIDHGLGVPSDALPRMFDKFFRVDNSDRREIKGTGLGLAICKQLVSAQGGQIWAESGGLGAGSEVHFTLPLAEQSRTVGDVLIVEDDHGFARLVGEELAGNGLTAMVVGSVETALRYLAEHTPRAILLDLIFPDERQGESLIVELAGRHDLHVPLVIVTVKDLDDGQQALLKSLGARAIFRKGPRVAIEAARAVARALAEEPAIQEGGQT